MKLAAWAMGLAVLGAPSAVAQENVIEAYSLTLDKRCHVAVVKVKLSRPAPVGIAVSSNLRFVGRVPFGPQRSARFVSKQSTERVFVWDLSVGQRRRYLKPGRYTAVLRAFDSGRKRVIDRSRRLKFRIPKSFASPPRNCGG